MDSTHDRKREVLHLRETDFRHLPWKNGRGVTEELALWPPHATFQRGDFDWRVSRAAIDENGPFSAFPGFDRILVVTAGRGLALTHGRDAARAYVRPLEPYLFSGDWPTSGELDGGPVADLNVLVRRDRHRADVQVSRLRRRRVIEALDAQDALVCVLSGSVLARVTGEDEPFALAAREVLWIRGAADGADVELSGRADDAGVILVRIARADDAD
ncbi:MAG: HutD family protein [Planctomycetota bacterium]